MAQHFEPSTIYRRNVTPPKVRNVHISDPQVRLSTVRYPGRKGHTANG